MFSRATILLLHIGIFTQASCSTTKEKIQCVQTPTNPTDSIHHIFTLTHHKTRTRTIHGYMTTSIDTISSDYQLNPVHGPQNPIIPTQIQVHIVAILAKSFIKLSSKAISQPPTLRSSPFLVPRALENHEPFEQNSSIHDPD